MNEFAGVVGYQVEQLVNELRSQRERRCREIEAEAKRRALELRESSRRKLRDRIRLAIGEERRHRESALLKARHRIETSERQSAQMRYRDLLHDAWPALRIELERRWADAECRRTWCEMLVGEAQATLASRPWNITHPADWTEQDSGAVGACVRACGLPEPEFAAEPEIRAGLRIRLDDACLDGTIDGLLERRSGVEARLLAVWEQELQADAGATNG